jgi:hypothetical protein
MRIVLMIAEDIWKTYGQELVVTSGLDGEHKASSLHYYGYALDFRTRYFSEKTKNAVYTDLKLALGKRYRVIKHDTHIHVENRDILNGNS